MSLLGVLTSGANIWGEFLLVGALVGSNASTGRWEAKYSFIRGDVERRGKWGKALGELGALE